MLYTAFLTDLAEVLAKTGRLVESLAAAAEALQRTEKMHFGGCRKHCAFTASF
jgi:hypothetical protein